MASLVTYAAHEGVATITMDDGKVNALSLAMQAEINTALDRAIAEKAAIVLSGREGKFSAGFDLATLAERGDNALTMLDGGFELALRLLTIPTPVVVACTGHTMAMGLFLAMSADYVIGTSGAYKFAANEVAIGMTMPRSALAISRNRINPAAFLRAMMSAQIFSPQEASEFGILDAHCPAENLAAQAQAEARRRLALNAPAYAGTKALLRESLLNTLKETMKADHLVFQKLCGLT